MGNEVLIRVRTEDDTKQGVDSAKRGLSSMEGSLGGVAAAAGAAFATDKLIGFGGEMLGLGAQMSAWDTKVTTVFEGQAASVDKWADKNNEAFGITDDKLAGLAAGFGDLLKPMGFTAEQAADMSKEVVGLAGALSAWSGGQVSAEETTQILADAMLGERDALKQLGISISAAEVEARLLEKGQQDLTGQALQQAEALATQELIFEKSTDAQKAWAEGGNEALAAQNELSAAVAELKEDISTGLTPALSTVANVMGGVLSSEAGRAALGVGAVGLATVAAVGPIQTLVENAKTLGSGLATATRSMGGLGKAAAFLGGPTALLAAGVALEQFNEAEQRANIDRLTDEFVAAGDSAKKMADVISSSLDKGPSEFFGTFEKLAETNRVAAERFVDQLAESEGESSEIVTKMRGALETLAKAEAQTAEDTEAAGAAMDGQAEAADGAADAAAGLGDVLFGAAEATGTAEDAAKEYDDALRGLFDPIFGATEALMDQQEAMASVREKTDALAEAVRTHGSDSIEAAEAQAELTAAQGDAQKAVVDLDAAARELHALVQEQPQALDIARMKFIDMAMAQGFTADEAAVLADQLGFTTAAALTMSNTPAVLNIHTNGFEQTAGQLTWLRDNFAGAQFNAQVNIKVNDGGLGIGKGVKVFHEGGVVPGSRGQEVAGILQAGEEVLALDDPRHTANMPGLALAAAPAHGGGGAVTVHLVVDSSAAPVDGFIAEMIRRYVAVKGGGDVQRALGWSR